MILKVVTMSMRDAMFDIWLNICRMANIYKSSKDHIVIFFQDKILI